MREGEEVYRQDTGEVKVDLHIGSKLFKNLYIVYYLTGKWILGAIYFNSFDQSSSFTDVTVITMF